MSENNENYLKEMKDSVPTEIFNAFEDALEKVKIENEKNSTMVGLLLQYIRNENRKENLAIRSKLLLNPPVGLTKDQVIMLLDEKSNYDEFKNINVLKSKTNTYYYDREIFTDRFANVQALILDKDLLATIANATRHDCKIYPRPLRVKSLKGQPYNFSEDEIMGALSRMKFEEKYSDIDTVTASNGKVCIFSSLYMSQKYAKALCEQLEVEWESNQ